MLIFVTDERSGLTGSLKNSEDLLQEAKKEENRLIGQVNALQTEVQTLTSAKEEVGIFKYLWQERLTLPTPLCLRNIHTSVTALLFIIVVLGNKKIRNCRICNRESKHKVSRVRKQ